DDDDIAAENDVNNGDGDGDEAADDDENNDGKRTRSDSLAVSEVSPISGTVASEADVKYTRDRSDSLAAYADELERGGNKQQRSPQSPSAQPHLLPPSHSLSSSSSSSSSSSPPLSSRGKGTAIVTPLRTMSIASSS